MRSFSLVPILFLSLMAPTLSAQRPKPIDVAATPEGQLLVHQVTDESDDAKKVALLEQFLAQHPNHEASLWVYSQMVTTCAKLGQYDKVMAAAEKVLAQDPADTDTAFAALKAAEAKKDPDAVRKWAILSSDLARKAAQAPKAGDEDADAFKQRVDGAKQLDTYTEYALFATAVQAPEAAKKVELFKTLEERNAESTYLSQGYAVYFSALLQTDPPASVALAEKLIAKGQGNELMLGTAADFYLHQNREPQKVLDYSAKLIAMVNSKPKPDGVSDADWQKSKDYLLGWGEWMTGAVYNSQAKFDEANKVLRAALPLLEGNEENKAGALFNLGMANSRLRNVGDAAKFFEQCIAIKSAYQSMCTDNLKTLRATHRMVK